MLATLSAVAAEVAEKTEVVNPVVPDELEIFGAIFFFLPAGSCWATSACRRS